MHNYIDMHNYNYMCELTVEIKTCTHFRYVAFLIKFEVVASKASFSQISSFKRGNNFKFKGIGSRYKALIVTILG